MIEHLDKLTDQEVRAAIGRRFENLADEIFQVVRWILVVGFVKYLSTEFPHSIFTTVYWGLAVILFIYLASRFLLRPEIPIVRNPRSRAQRLFQTAVNMVLCMLLFMVVLWAVGSLTDAIAASHDA